MHTYLSLLLLFCLTVLSVTQVQAQAKNQTQTNLNDKEWVIVFNDPRPARLQDWQSSGYSKGGSGYRSALELKRFANKEAKRYNLELTGQWYIESLSVYCLVVRFKGDAADTITALQANKKVQWVQPSNEFELLSSGLTSKKEGLKQETESSGSDVEISNGLKKTRHSLDGAGVTVAIIDSAVDLSHQDFIGASHNKSTNFVTGVQGAAKTQGEKHGTAIAGVMISQTSTLLGVAGVSPAVNLESYRGCWEHPDSGFTRCNTLSLARSLDAVLKSNVDIVNLSLSGPKDDLLDRLIKRIIERGSIVVAAFDPKRAMKPRFPSPREGVLIVRAQELDKQFDSVFTAPGERVVPTPGNGYDYMHGHSVASAYTSGLLALRKQALEHRTLSADALNTAALKGGDVNVTNQSQTHWRNVSTQGNAQGLLNGIL